MTVTDECAKGKKKNAVETHLDNRAGSSQVWIYIDRNGFGFWQLHKGSFAAISCCGFMDESNDQHWLRFHHLYCVLYL